MTRIPHAPSIVVTTLLGHEIRKTTMPWGTLWEVDGHGFANGAMACLYAFEHPLDALAA
jgi:hypothetical protein